MSPLSLLSLCIIACTIIPIPLTSASYANSGTIVLWHGFIGWGRNELLGFKYWGGLWGDVQQDLTSQGHTVVTVAMGPVSSSWDRVCEAYAQLVGGTVDYGIAHSQQHRHTRFQRTYPGLIPNIGDNNKIHIIAHSMGGQDSRLFASLLLHGDATERAACAAANVPCSSLFMGGHHWIASIATINSPHDGTSLATGIDTFLPFVKNALAGIIGAAGLTGDIGRLLFDFKLDQWGLVQGSNENAFDYVQRVFDPRSPIYQSGFKDISLYDLSPDGAAALNARIKNCDDDIYYLTYASDATYNFPFTKPQFPEPLMFAVFWPFATFMGSYSRDARDGRIPIDSSWYVTDGVVNTRGMAGATLSTTCGIKTYQRGGSIQTGGFSYMGFRNSYDHAAVIGVGIYNIKPWYRGLASLQRSIPTTSTSYTPSSQATSFAIDTIDIDIRDNTTNYRIQQCIQGWRVYRENCVSGSNSSIPQPAGGCNALLQNAQKCDSDLAIYTAQLSNDPLANDSSTSSSSSSSFFTTGIIIGIAVGSAALLVFFISTVLYIHRRKSTSVRKLHMDNLMASAVATSSVSIPIVSQA